MSNPDKHFQYRTPVLFPETILTKLCPKCGAEFRTGSRIKKRCDACQAAVTAARGLAEDAARRARRKGARG